MHKHQILTSPFRSLLFFLLLLLGENIFGSIVPDSFIRVPMRGNSLDIHFTNLTNGVMKAEPLYFDNSDKVPKPDNRNLIFIPNTGNTSENSPHNMPLDFKLKEAVILNSEAAPKVISGRFVQSILSYNNMSTYRDDMMHYGYSQNENYISYSAFMWSNGVVSKDDGQYAFSNAMSEINNLKYRIKVDIDEERRIEFNLLFSTESHIKTEQTEKVSKYIKMLTYVGDYADHVAALTSLASGIFAIPSAPAAGVIMTISGAAWEVQATAQTMIDNLTLRDRYETTETGASWLSSPFDIFVQPAEFLIKNSRGETVYIPEFNEEQGSVLFYLGNDTKPESILLQISASTKGDLFVTLISSSLSTADSIKDVADKNEFKTIRHRKVN